MSQVPFALQFVVLAVSGWLTRRQQFAIEYLLEENRVLRQQLGNRRLRLTDAQRRRLAVRGRKLERKVLEPIPDLGDRIFGQDGGGSTTMVVPGCWLSDTVNYPSDNLAADHWGARLVGSGVYVR